MSKQRINEDWPEEIQAAFLAHPESTVLAYSTDFGTTVYTTSDYVPPTDGIDHLNPVEAGF
jgi:hypothetical protein